MMMTLIRVSRQVARVDIPWKRYYSNWTSLAPHVKEFVQLNVELCQPAAVHVCDGSTIENEMLLNKLVEQGKLTKLTKYHNCYLARTVPEDVARLEDRTFICTSNQRDAIPIPKEGIKSQLGYWKDPDEMEAELRKKFSGCMKGRTMYVIPFSMGPINSPLAKIGIQLTDSEYVVASMRIMTRMGSDVLKRLEEQEKERVYNARKDAFVRCVHSVGYPLPPGEKDVKWPCNPGNVTIAHFVERNIIVSYGSGYGGNSLLGKKCFALRIASSIARNEGWLAEHMLVLGITNPEGKKRYIAAAFPSACGKTNLAMMKPSLPGWKVECVGDDIAWMKFDSKGQLRALNPENGFFGVAPGTSSLSNPHAMDMIKSNTIFTNVAHTSDGGVFWEGMEKDIDLSNVTVTSWTGEKNWTKNSGTKAAHPNSRFCTPISQCAAIDPRWEDSDGVPIDAILFGGRRPTTIPLVCEAFNWQHGVFMGATMRSETTAAAELKEEIRHDPFGMKPFFGYSFAQYLEHWISLENRKDVKVPKIFYVNWFRKDVDGNFIWPGFGDNARVLEWIFRRLEGENIAKGSALGMVPKSGTINTQGMRKIDMQSLFADNKLDLKAEIEAIQKFFKEQLPQDLPNAMKQELQALQDRVAKLPDTIHQ